MFPPRQLSPWPLLLAASCVLLPGCDRPEQPLPSRGDASVEAPAPDRVAGPDRPRIVVLGDSLTAGLGLPPHDAFPSVLQRYVDESGLSFEVVNAGVSGDTSAGGLRRLDWALEGEVRIVILALGANDGLRGLPVGELEANLSAMIETARRDGVEVVLCGMEAPPNFGPEYTVEFREAFASVASRYEVPFVPFLLAGVAGVPSLNQDDGIHPNAEGAKRVADLVWATLQPIAETIADD